MVAALAVGGAAVGAAVGAVALDHEVVHVGVDGRNRQAQSAFVATGDAIFYFGPGFAAVF